MILRAAAFCAIMLGTAAALPPVPLNGDWREAEIIATPHQLRGDAEPHEPLIVGALVYHGGLNLTSPDPAFGGFSGLEVSSDGRELLAISDRGQWLKASLSYSEDGRLAGASQGRMSAITDKDGVVLAGPIADAEGLSRTRDGSLIVSFEREARIDRYRLRNDGMIVLDAPLASLQGEPDAPGYNKGIEAVAATARGFLALFEDALPSGVAGLWFEDDERTPVRYSPARDFSVTDAEFDGDDVIILERAFSKLRGVRSRIVRARIGEDGAIAGEPLASFGALYAIDNFEGVAIRNDGDRQFLYVISDDNHSTRQKTLLLMFEVAE